MEDLNEKLLTKIKELGELELTDQELSLGIFLKKANSLIEEKLSKIELEINSKMDFYNVRNPDNETKKAEILEKYEKEFKKILEKYEDRFINIQIEMQNAQSNQKIALANWSKVLEDKENLAKSELYKEYIFRKKELEYSLENTMKSEEFYRYDKLLKELQNPLERLDIKANACIEKFNHYNQIIDECLIEVNICEKEITESLNSVVKYQFNDKLAVQNPFEKITRIINKIVFKFSGASKFQKEVILKMENDLKEIENKNSEVINVIDNKSDTFIATILMMKEKINEDFKVAIS